MKYFLNWYHDFFGNPAACVTHEAKGVVVGGKIPNLIERREITEAETKLTLNQLKEKYPCKSG